MSLINLNPFSASSSLPRYDSQVFDPVTDIELSGFGWDTDIENTEEIYVISQPNFYRNSLDANGSVDISFPAISEYVLIYQNIDANWTLVQTIDSTFVPGLPVQSTFGYSVSLSKNSGEYLAIGTYSRTSGAARSFVYLSDLGSPPAYTLQEEFDTSGFGTIANDTTNIGHKVQLNATGDHLIVMGTTGIIEQFSRSGTTWTHDTGDTIPAIATYATASAALVGMDANADHTIIIRGCPLFPVGAAFGAQTGQVEVFKSGTTASQTFNGSAGDRIGAGVAVSSNGLFMAYSALKLAVELDLRVIDTGGYVSIFNTVSGSFTSQATITGTSVKTETGSFGSDIAFNQTGDVLIIGDAFTNNYSGSQYNFGRLDDVWSQDYEIGATFLVSEVVSLTLPLFNYTLNINEGSGAVNVDMDVGSYSGSTLAAEIETQLNADGGLSDTYTITYDNVGKFFNLDSTGSFEISSVGSINEVIGFSTTSSTGFAGDHASEALPSFSYNGTELGRNVNVSELGSLGIIVGGLPGKEGPSSNGVGKSLLATYSTAINIFQTGVIIDTTENEALLVRKNNDAGDVFIVDTANSEVSMVANTVIDTTNTEAFLIRKSSDTGDVFTVNSVSSEVTFAGSLLPSVTAVPSIGSFTNRFYELFLEDSLFVYGGIFGSGLTSDSIVLGCEGAQSMPHRIGTRHELFDDPGNAIDFYLWAFGDDENTPGTKRVLTLDGEGTNGNIVIYGDSDLSATSGVTTIGSTTALTVSAAGLLTVNNATDATTPTATASIHTEGGISIEKNLSTDTASFGTTTVSNKFTGTISLSDDTTSVITGMVFTGHKSYVAEIHVAVFDASDGDLVSNYRVSGVNETIGGNGWTIGVIRTGVSDPNVTFSVTAGTGQLSVTTPDSYTAFSSGNLYYDVISNIE